MTIRDIYDYIIDEWCSGCFKFRNNGYICPYSLSDTEHYCALDSVIISLDYIARGEYYG